MDNNNKSIHEFDFNLICEYFSGLQRQGPGSVATTRKAASFIEGLSDDSLIADLGCGTGTQTLTLAGALPGHITAMDLFPKFIDIMKENVAREGLADRITPQVGSMGELPFEKGSLDLIWSEGAIYNIGFEHGIRYWRDYLKEGGYIAVSEGTWFTDERPAEIEEFWAMNYPEIDTIPIKVAQMQAAGYVPVATFVNPDSDWFDYFAPTPAAQEAFLAKYPDSRTARELIDNQRREMGLYDKYRKYYGYAFYIGRKV
jgi:SAM-dependent methyltransferase